jgi:hypothetical protein
VPPGDLEGKSPAVRVAGKEGEEGRWERSEKGERGVWPVHFNFHGGGKFVLSLWVRLRFVLMRCRLGRG